MLLFDAIGCGRKVPTFSPSISFDIVFVDTSTSFVRPSTLLRGRLLKAVGLGIAFVATFSPPRASLALVSKLLRVFNDV